MSCVMSGARLGFPGNGGSVKSCENSPKNYCPYPFTQVTTTPTGQFKLCCSSSEAYGFVSDFPGKIDFSISDGSIMKFWNSDYMNWVRDNHKNGKPIRECEVCTSYEKSGNESYRQRAIKELGVHKEALRTPMSLDLKLGNRCNAKCLFCDPSSSSQVYDEWKQIGWDQAPPFQSGLTGWVTPELFEIDYDWASRPEFWNELIEISPEVKNLKFTGGEPLVNTYMIRYLDYLVEAGLSVDMRLQITTNGISVPNRFLDLIKNFREVEINFSVDGFGRQNEYIRYPTKWERWLKNVEKTHLAATPTTNLYFQHSFSFYSVFGLTEYFRWMWPYKDFGFHIFKVFHPDFQQPEVLGEDEKSEVLEDLARLKNELAPQVSCERDEKLLSEINGIFLHIQSQENRAHLKPKLKSFIETLDKHRGISIVDHMPRAAEALGF